MNSTSRVEKKGFNNTTLLPTAYYCAPPVSKTGSTNVKEYRFIQDRARPGKRIRWIRSAGITPWPSTILQAVILSTGAQSTVRSSASSACVLFFSIVVPPAAGAAGEYPVPVCFVTYLYNNGPVGPVVCFCLQPPLLLDEYIRILRRASTCF